MAWRSRLAHVANLNMLLPRVGATKPRAVRFGGGSLILREPQFHRVQKLATPFAARIWVEFDPFLRANEVCQNP
jgi:hypothetical protein